MPDLSNSLHLIDATIYLYSSVEEAEQGAQAGGSGMIVSVPLVNRSDLCVFYAVTNWHVACKHGSSVIRYTALDGSTQILDKDPSEWEYIPAGPDIAITPIIYQNSKVPHSIPLYAFLWDGDDIFIGEDVFMIGRFKDFDGALSNKPALRFGAISMLEAAVPQETGYKGNSIILDMRSRSGFSGSPVFAYRDNGLVSQRAFVGVDFSSNLKGPLPRNWGTGTNTIVKLIGLHWGQFAEPWELKVANPKHPISPLVPADLHIEGMSGMTCAVPANDIIRVLNEPALIAHRQAAEEKAAAFPKSEPITTNLALGDKFRNAFGCGFGV